MNVDVIIPIYNQAKYLPQALESTLKQGILKKNIYLIDDCSSDRPDLIASKYDINFLKTNVNSGPAVARNLGIKSSHSEFVAFLDADDVMLPGRILSSLTSLLQSGAGMVCGLNIYLELLVADNTNYIHPHSPLHHFPFLLILV